MMKKDIQDRLRKLGVVKGPRKLQPAPKVDLPPLGRSDYLTERDGFDAPRLLADLLPGGQVVETAVGGCYVLDKVYPLSYRHGDDTLQDLLAHSPATAAVFSKDGQLGDLHFQDFLFIDTETTGLAGAGTLAFMVGAAFFEKRIAFSEKETPFDELVLVVRQYFLRDHGDEAAMLTLLEELVADKTGLISFNGRSFDLPLLDGRYLMNRMLNPMLGMPHIDLLPPARRLWRKRLDSCALSALEPNLLGVQRTHDDVPGWLIPSLYHNYLRSGNAQELMRVFYHNQLDMVSMVTLAARILRLFDQPNGDDHPIDLFSLGKWQADLGLTAVAEQNLRLAVQGDLPLTYFHEALYRLGTLLKRNGRRAEAVSLWQQIATTSFDDVAAHIELAKQYEWHQKSLLKAMQWTEEALKLCQSWGRRGEIMQAELEHRLNRLKRKEASCKRQGENKK